MNSNPIDAILVVSFGGPEGPDDVMPFLENVLRGRNVPRERMLEVAEHYMHFGGVSPINEQNRDLIAALEVELADAGLNLPIYFANRNWHPLIPDTLRRMRDESIHHAMAFFTSAFSSYSGCRQYRENIRDAQAEVGEGVPHVSKLRHFFNHPGYVETIASRIEDELEKVEPSNRIATRLVFTAHSIPMSMATSCSYEAQLLETSRLVADRLGMSSWQLAYQSRSGPPTQPWLEPDICDCLQAWPADAKGDAVIVVPIGFISDHMEVLYDLDVEAAQVARECDIELLRAKTAGTHPRFVSMIRELIQERLDGENQRPALGELGPSHDECPVDCCPYPRRN